MSTTKSYIQIWLGVDPTKTLLQQLPLIRERLSKLVDEDHKKRAKTFNNFIGKVENAIRQLKRIKVSTEEQKIVIPITETRECLLRIEAFYVAKALIAAAGFQSTFGKDPHKPEFIIFLPAQPEAEKHICKGCVSADENDHWCTGKECECLGCLKLNTFREIHVFNDHYTCKKIKALEALPQGSMSYLI